MKSNENIDRKRANIANRGLARLESRPYRLSLGMNLSRRLLRIVSSMLLALLAAPAFALGLGQIQVKSRSGQPLLAEIPIVSSDPAELHGLQARLASPETFSRIGLEPPAGIVSDLQFAPALDQQGRPVIRVTTARPVDQPFIKFLVQVDWGQGQLVREYSALVDTPTAVAAPVQPPIQAPTAAPDNRIERASVIEAPLPSTPVAAAPAEQTSAAEPVPATEQTAAPVAQATEPTPASDTAFATNVVAGQAPASPTATMLPEEIEPAPTPQPESAPEVALAPQEPPPGSVPTAPASDEIVGQGYTVQRGDSLSDIATRISGIRGVSRNQTMVAMLRANPEAFIGGNINLIKAGARLRIPEVSEVFATEAADADALIRDHVRNWRSGQAPVAQPAAVAGSENTNPAGNRTRETAQAQAGARLEIAPPSAANARNAGNTSGMSAGGEGEMLRQELQQTQETLAARNAEVEELKARVAELETLQQDQQRMIQLKDTELASAQARTANTAQTSAAATANPPAARDAGTPNWLWAIPIALLLGTIAVWLLARRRRATVPKSSTSSRHPPLDLSSPMPPTQHAETNMPDAPVVPAQSPSNPPVPEPEEAGPAWARPGNSPLPQRPAPQLAAAVADPTRPTWFGPYDNAQTNAALPGEHPDDARLEQARTCIEQGDLHGARQRLHDVIENGEARARAEAGRLLRELS